jgi:hypothetical protein
MIQQRVEANHREVQKVEEVNHDQNLVDQMQEVKMVLMVLLKRDRQVHKDMNKDQRLILIMILNKILNRD